MQTQAASTMHIPTKHLSLGADDEISAAEAKFEGLRMTAGSIPVTSRGGETPRA